MAFSIKETFEDGWPIQTTLALSWRGGSPSGESLPARVHLLMSLVESGAVPPAVEVVVFAPGLGVPNTPLADSGKPPEECLFYHLIQPGAQPDPLTSPPYFIPKKPGIYNICFRIPIRSKKADSISPRRTVLSLSVRLTSGDGETIEIPLGEKSASTQTALSGKIHPPKPAPIEKPEPVGTAKPHEKDKKANGNQAPVPDKGSGPARAKKPTPSKKRPAAHEGCFIFFNLIALLLVLLLLAMAFLGVPGIQLFGF